MDKITGMVKSQGDFQPNILEVNDDAPTISFGSRPKTDSGSNIIHFQDVGLKISLTFNHPGYLIHVFFIP